MYRVDTDLVRIWYGFGTGLVRVWSLDFGAFEGYLGGGEYYYRVSLHYMAQKRRFVNLLRGTFWGAVSERPAVWPVRR